MLNRIWLAMAIAFTFMCGVAFVVVQQVMRQAANDPQASMAQDAAAALDAGTSPSSLVPGHINLPDDTAPFIIVYDVRGDTVAGNAYIANVIPRMPQGVLHHTALHTSHAVTWQPAANVRVASITVKANNYYVVSGRSLFTTEHRYQMAAAYLTAMWLITMASIGACAFLTRDHKSRTGTV